MRAEEVLESYALAVGDNVVIDLRTTRQHTIEGTVTNATERVVIIDQRDGAVISRIPWASVLTIQSVGSAVRHPAT